MNLHLLRLFATVAERGSFSRAAEALRVGQPAVSKGVKELEAQVGLPLLERAPGPVVPTDAGAALLVHARAIFASEREAEEALAAIAGISAGTLRVGASTTIATWIIPPFLARFRGAHPRVELKLVSANTASIARLTIEREIDVALVEGPVDDPRLRAEAWRTDELVLVVGAGHAFSKRRRSISPADLGETLVLLREEGSGTREVVRSALGSHGVVLRQTMEIGSTEAIKQAVAAGLGASFVSRSAAEDQVALGRLRIIPLAGIRIRRPIRMLSIPGRTPSPAAAAFDALLRTPAARGPGGL